MKKECWKCFATFETPSGNARYCKSCRVIVDEEQRIARYHRTVIERTCQICGDTFIGGPNSQYCHEHRHQVQQEKKSIAMKARWREKRGEEHPYTSTEVWVKLIAKLVDSCNGDWDCHDCWVAYYCDKALESCHSSAV